MRPVACLSDVSLTMSASADKTALRADKLQKKAAKQQARQQKNAARTQKKAGQQPPGEQCDGMLCLRGHVVMQSAVRGAKCAVACCSRPVLLSA